MDLVRLDELRLEPCGRRVEQRRYDYNGDSGDNNNENDVPSRKRPRREKRCSPPTNTYVRYLFDSQLFNVPNNEKQCGFLLTYLHHERIFDVSYVVTVGTDNRLLRGAWSGGGGGFADKKRSSSRWNGFGFDEGATQKIHEERRCAKLYERLRSAAGARGEEGSGSSNRAYVPMFNASEAALRGPQNPVNRRDVRSLMQMVRLSGNPDEDWLDLKIQLCLPSIILYVKLQGSVTQVPNADFTVEVNMRELQLLGSEETLGQKLAGLLAHVRRRYFNVPVPDFERVQLLDDTDIYGEDDDEDDDEDRAAATTTVAYEDETAAQTTGRTATTATTATSENLQAYQLLNRPPPPPSAVYLDPTDAARMEQQLTEYRSNAIRTMLGGGTVQNVQKLTLH